jgi:hypothetical protein
MIAIIAYVVTMTASALRQMRGQRRLVKRAN